VTARGPVSHELDLQIGSTDRTDPNVHRTPAVHSECEWKDAVRLVSSRPPAKAGQDCYDTP